MNWEFTILQSNVLGYLFNASLFITILSQRITIIIAKRIKIPKTMAKMLLITLILNEFDRFSQYTFEGSGASWTCVAIPIKLNGSWFSITIPSLSKLVSFSLIFSVNVKSFPKKSRNKACSSWSLKITNAATGLCNL